MQVRPEALPTFKLTRKVPPYTPGCGSIDATSVMSSSEQFGRPASAGSTSTTPGEDEPAEVLAVAASTLAAAEVPLGLAAADVPPAPGEADPPPELTDPGCPEPTVGAVDGVPEPSGDAASPVADAGLARPVAAGGSSEREHIAVKAVTSKKTPANTAARRRQYTTGSSGPTVNLMVSSRYRPRTRDRDPPGHRRTPPHRSGIGLTISTAATAINGAVGLLLIRTGRRRRSANRHH